MSLRDQLTEIKEQGLADIQQTSDLKTLNGIPVSYTHLTLPTNSRV